MADRYSSFFALLTSFPSAAGCLELRARNPISRRTVRLWTSPEQVDEIRDWLARRGSSPDAFFSIARRDGGGSGARALVSLPALWANVNHASVHVPPEMPPPTAIVFTGRGHHLYWVLQQAVELTPEKIPTIDRILRGLARRVQGDPGSAQVSHFLRIPGTFNAKYRPPVSTALVLLEPGRRASLQAFLAFADPPRLANPELRPKGAAGDGDISANDSD
ncbi:MAG: hypothetical protein ACE5JN_13905 [Candidatus Methylomirabilia bacterium]